MKKGYIWKRLLRSFLSVFIIMIIVFIMLYSLVPRENIFFEDSTYKKLGGKPDDKMDYVMRTWEKLGYLDYVSIYDYCDTLYEQGSAQMEAAVQAGSKECNDFVKLYEEKGYTIEYLQLSKQPYAHKDIPLARRVVNWVSKMIVIDTPWSVQDPNNPDLARYIKLGRTPTGGLALVGSGTTHKYLIYTDTNFPFIHQNIITLNLGTSYPKFEGMGVLDVIFSPQGTDV